MPTGCCRRHFVFAHPYFAWSELRLFAGDRAIGARFRHFDRLHAVMLQVTRRGEVGMLLCEGRVSGRTLGLVRSLLVIAGTVRVLRGAMMSRGALVVVRGTTVVF
jgi:hypothetical protein